MAIIEVARGPNPGHQYRVQRDTTILGRHPECDIVLDVAAVSRQHAQILREPDGFYVQDLKSRNGTFVNGQMIRGRELLSEGDLVKICDVDLVFHSNSASDDLAGPKPKYDSSSSIALLVPDEGSAKPRSTIMTTINVASGGGNFLAARPEVKLRAMIEIMQNLGKMLSLEDVLPRVLDSLFKIFPQADRGFVVLQLHEGRPPVPMAVKHRRPGSEEMARLSSTIVTQAMETGEAILSADAASDERFNMAQSIADFQIRSLMCAPLIDSDGKSLGVLQIDTLDQRSRFTEDDLEVLASVASQAAVFIDNAQLHERSLEQEKLSRDLVLARTVQQGLLPSSPPAIAGYHFFNFYEAANQVGGDYFDYIPLPGNRMAIVLGDVAGKGVSAALLMAKLAGDVRYRLASEPSVEQAVCRINRGLTLRSLADRFVTFVAAVLDPAKHEVTLVNAGHMAPLLRSAEGRVEAVGESDAGLPLGVVEDTEYRSLVFQLAPGDCLTIFTDGFSEALNDTGDMYGLERMQAFNANYRANVGELASELLSDVRKFVGGQEQSDDMCLICFGRDE